MRADIILPQSEQQAMLHGFERIEKVELGEGFHERYHQLARELAGRDFEKGENR